MQENCVGQANATIQFNMHKPKSGRLMGARLGGKWRDFETLGRRGNMGTIDPGRFARFCLILSKMSYTMICLRFFFVLAFCFLTGFAGSATVTAQVTIVGYDSTNPNGAGGAPSPDLPATESVSNVTALFLSRGAGLTPNPGITFNSNHWSTSSTVDAASNDYVQWGWSGSTQGYDLEDMTIQYDRSNTGPTQLEIFVSINGGDMQSVFLDTDIFIGDETHTIDLSYLDDVDSAEFRLFGFDASQLGGTLDIERFNSDPDPSRAIIVRGFAVAVPEPSGGLLVIGLVFGLMLKRRKYNATE